MVVSLVAALSALSEFFANLADKESPNLSILVVALPIPSLTTVPSFAKTIPAKTPKAESVLKKLPDKKSAKGTSVIANNAPNFCPKSEIFAPSLSKEATDDSSDGSIAENFDSACSNVAFKNA